MEERTLLEKDIEKAKQEKEKDKRRWPLYIIILILILLLLCRCGTKQEFFPIGGEDIVLNDPICDESGEILTEIVGQANVTINEKNPYLLLINSPNNQVYFQYDVMLNDEVLESTDVFLPDSMVKVNLYKKLQPGNYDIVLKLSTYDIDTQVENTGANSIVKVVVE